MFVSRVGCCKCGETEDANVLNEVINFVDLVHVLGKYQKVITDS